MSQEMINKLNDSIPAGTKYIDTLGNVHVYGDVFTTDISGNKAVRTTASITGDINVDALSIDTAGLIGKPLGTNSDFITAYTSPTTITCSGFPGWVSGLNDKDILAVIQLNTAGTVVASYARDDTPITVTANVITIAAATFGATDTFVVYTNIPRAEFGRLKARVAGATSTGLVGKSTGGDFTTAYTAATQITVSNLPATHTSLIRDDIVGIIQINSAGMVVKAYWRDDTTIAVSANVITVTGAAFTNTDSFVIYTNINSSSGSSGVSLTADYKSPADFTATYASSTTLTISGLPFTPDNSQLVYIRKITSGGVATIFVAGQSGVSLTISTTTITITGAGTPFAASDVYEIGINGNTKGYDNSLDAFKHVLQNPIWNRYTDVQTLVAAATPQDVTNGWVDLGTAGTEIDMRGYNTLSVYFTLDINSSLNFRIRALGKHTFAGSEEYNLAIKTVGPSDIKIESEYLEWNVDADQLTVFRINTDNAIPFVQLQIMAETVGVTAGQCDAAYYIKSWT